MTLFSCDSGWTECHDHRCPSPLKPGRPPLCFWPALGTGQRQLPQPHPPQLLASFPAFQKFLVPSTAPILCLCWPHPPPKLPRLPKLTAKYKDLFSGWTVPTWAGGVAQLRHTGLARLRPWVHPSTAKKFPQISLPSTRCLSPLALLCTPTPASASRSSDSSRAPYPRVWSLGTCPRPCLLAVPPILMPSSPGLAPASATSSSPLIAIILKCKNAT